MKICFISCDNGFGHLSRLSFIANQFKNKKIVFYGKNKKFLNKKIKFKLLRTLTIKKNKFNTKYKWYKKFNKLNFNSYVSDNLPEIASEKKNSFILANFFWHRLFNINNSFYKNLEKKMIENKVKIFANKYFYFKYLEKFNLKKIGFIGQFNRKKFLFNNNIFISLGSEDSNTKKKFFKEFNKIINLQNNNQFNFYFEGTDKKYLKKNNKITNKKRKEIMSNISLIIAKPGMGIITDAVSRGVPILIFNKEKNKEFIHNEKILLKMQIGKKLNDLKNINKTLIKIFLNKDFFLNTYEICKKLEWNAEKKIIKALNFN